MRRQRFQIVLLVLGAVLGYGYAFSQRAWHGHHRWDHCSQSHGRDFERGEHYDRGRTDEHSPAATPPKSEN
jgi:hypothetical protein